MKGSRESEMTSSIENLKSKIENWKAEPRADLQEKVVGKAKYVEDLPDLPGMVYGAQLLSPYSHAWILSIDSSKA